MGRTARLRISHSRAMTASPECGGLLGVKGSRSRRTARQKADIQDCGRTVQDFAVRQLGGLVHPGYRAAVAGRVHETHRAFDTGPLGTVVL
jgi:hypothetical protein